MTGALVVLYVGSKHIYSTTCEIIDQQCYALNKYLCYTVHLWIYTLCCSCRRIITFSGLFARISLDCFVVDLFYSLYIHCILLHLSVLGLCLRINDFMLQLQRVNICTVAIGIYVEG